MAKIGARSVMFVAERLVERLKFSGVLQTQLRPWLQFWQRGLLLNVRTVVKLNRRRKPSFLSVAGNVNPCLPSWMLCVYLETNLIRIAVAMRTVRKSRDLEC